MSAHPAAEVTQVATTLEQQLDALIAEHGLSSITLTRIVVGDRRIWSINAQGGGQIGADTDDCPRPATAREGLAAAIASLNAKRAAPVLVPELAVAA